MSDSGCVDIEFCSMRIVVYVYSLGKYNTPIYTFVFN